MKVGPLQRLEFLKLMLFESQFWGLDLGRSGAVNRVKWTR